MCDTNGIAILRPCDIKVLWFHSKPFLECSSRRSAIDRNNFGVVGLADEIIHQVGGKLLRQMAVELVVREALAVFVVDVHTFAGIVTQHAKSRAGQHRFDDLESIGLETKMCRCSERCRGKGRFK